MSLKTSTTGELLEQMELKQPFNGQSIELSGKHVKFRSDSEAILKLLIDMYAKRKIPK